ncbi:MAG TPA: hypothetical protein DCQ34_05730 [Chitinophagaceae bacterium]|nr:hypothetical protein [Chitinophagaceae bacterium]HCY89413.1 hypothetical protein [Chitinophagaceae bacterium]HRF27352.1 flavin reductase family protein [Ferruginibacter sp.]
MTRKKPWNRVNLPVYSISSKGPGGFNMNIITYTVPVSMKPKRLICAVYHGSQTLDNIRREKQAVLQLLHEDQYRLVDKLGKRSGKNTDKLTALNKRNLCTEWKGFPVLTGALAWMELKVLDEMEGGDHRLFLCEVQAWKNNSEGEPLTLDMLRKKNIIRG